MTKDLKPTKCRSCGKLFYCQGRLNLLRGKTPQPRSDCLSKTQCECEKCNPANKGSDVCKNINLQRNPSRRDSKVLAIEDMP